MGEVVTVMALEKLGSIGGAHKSKEWPGNILYPPKQEKRRGWQLDQWEEGANEKIRSVCVRQGKYGREECRRRRN